MLDKDKWQTKYLLSQTLCYWATRYYRELIWIWQPRLLPIHLRNKFDTSRSVQNSWHLTKEPELLRIYSKIHTKVLNSLGNFGELLICSSFMAITTKFSSLPREFESLVKLFGSRSSSIAPVPTNNKHHLWFGNRSRKQEKFDKSTKCEQANFQMI